MVVLDRGFMQQIKRSIDFKDALVMGVVPDAEMILIDGWEPSSGAVSTMEDIWPFPTASVGFTFNAGEVAIEALSDSVEDGTTGLTGAAKIKVEYLNALFITKIAEITLNGTGIVAGPTDVKYMQRAWVSEWGANSAVRHTNIGNITIRILGAGAPLEYIVAGNNASQSARYTIPKGKRGFIMDWSVVGSQTAGPGAIVHVLADKIKGSTVEYAFMIVDSFLQGRDSFNQPKRMVQPFEEGTTIIVAINPGGNSERFNVSMQIALLNTIAA